MVSTAVIILNWNGQELLRKYLPSVLKYTNPAIGKVIVADNGSTDGSLEVLKNEFPEAEVWAFDRNYGFARGYNIALERALKEGYEYTLLLNSDVRVSPDWLDPLVSFMSAHPQAAACQPKILSDVNPNKFEYAGAAGGFLDKHGYPYCRGRILGHCETDHGQYDGAAVPVFWASGAALLVRTRIYEEVGGLDTHFFAHMEEIDLCWRMQLAGFKVFAVTDSTVYHLGGASLSALNPRKTYLNFRNNLLMLHKNLPDRTRSYKLFVRRLLDTLAFGNYMATLKWKHAAAVVKAHNDFRRMHKMYTIHPEVDLLDESQESQRNIITDYYLHGKRTFA